MKNGNAIMLVLIMVNSLFFGINVVSHKPQYKLYGKPGDPVGHPISNCNDPALTYINCDGWLNYRPNDLAHSSDYKGTTVIMGVALSVAMWEKLEQLGVDIIRYVMPNDHEYGGYGIDTLSGVTDANLGYTGADHGFAVASVFATIANNSRIIYIAMDISTGTGFSSASDNPASWNWIKNHANEYDIDVVSMSWGALSITVSDVVKNTITYLHDNLNIFLVSSIGQDKIDNLLLGAYFPSGHKYVYSVGSVDHEDRGRYILYSYGFYWDNDYYSKKGYYTGTAVGSPFISGYGTYFADGDSSLDFAMPGNGVPFFSFEHDSWYYGIGTSFSAPYLAAAAIIAVSAFNKGYFSRSGLYSDPTAGQIHDLLKGAASQSTSWTQRMGYGYVDLLDLYNNAYNLGYASAPGNTCTPIHCIGN